MHDAVRPGGIGSDLRDGRDARGELDDLGVVLENRDGEVLLDEGDLRQELEELEVGHRDRVARDKGTSRQVRVPFAQLDANVAVQVFWHGLEVLIAPVERNGRSRGRCQVRDVARVILCFRRLQMELQVGRVRPHQSGGKEAVTRLEDAGHRYLQGTRDLHIGVHTSDDVHRTRNTMIESTYTSL